jgi:hypothetical protein
MVKDWVRSRSQPVSTGAAEAIMKLAKFCSALSEAT